nr:hypothetical protein BaRGS_034790 [Batillaria attramentaria]
MTSADLFDSFQRLLLNDFKPEAEGNSGSLSKDEHICHREVRGDQDNYASFVYVCCHSDREGQGQVVCTDVLRDPWILSLLVAVLVIKVLVVLFSPSLLPESLYRLKYATLQYVYHLPQYEQMTLRMLVTATPWVYGHDDRVVRLNKLPGLPKLRALGETWQRDRVHDVTVRHVQLAIKARKLLAENYVPVGAFRLLYNNLFLCRLRHLSPFTDCCGTNVLGTLNPGLRMPTWFRCARVLARILLLIVIVLPWIIRLGLYYYYEKPVVEWKQQAATRAGLHLPFTGSFTLFLTPLHVLFVVCYVILCVDSLVYGVLASSVKHRLKLVFLRCLRDMKERSKVSVCGWVTSLVVLPFTLCGVIGFLILPFYLVLLLPLLLPLLAFYLFPAINLSVRLLLHVFIFVCPNRAARAARRAWNTLVSRVNQHMKFDTLTADESFERRSSFSQWELPFQVLVVLVCLVSFWSVTFLVMELLSFGVEMAVYTFIGLIVTADITSQYLSVIFFLFLYGHGCFSTVHKKYLNYHRVIHQQLLAMMRHKIDNIARAEEMDQENTALRVQGDMAPPTDTPPVKLLVQNDRLRWATSSLLLFLDKQDTPYIPERFFEETVDLNYCGCPGKLYVNLLAALWSFLQIIVFLLFVFVVVMAFGSAYSVSSTNQLLATVAGGFIPFVFTHFFSRSHQGASVDPESVQFKTNFHTAINSLASGRPSSEKFEKAESIDWEDTSLDIIFDVSKTDGRRGRAKRGLGEYDAGSQSMLSGSGGKDGGEGGGAH